MATRLAVSLVLWSLSVSITSARSTLLHLRLDLGVQLVELAVLDVARRCCRWRGSGSRRRPAGSGCGRTPAGGPGRPRCGRSGWASRRPCGGLAGVGEASVPHVVRRRPLATTQTDPSVTAVTDRRAAAGAPARPRRRRGRARCAPAGRSTTRSRAARRRRGRARRRSPSTSCAGSARPRSCARRLAPKAPPPRGRRAAAHRAGAALAGRATPPYAEHTLVDQAVAAARAARAGAAPASSTPCCAASCASATRSSPPRCADPVARFNHPAWWLERLRADWPDRSGRRSPTPTTPHPPMTLRVNARRGDAAGYVAAAGRRTASPREAARRRTRSRSTRPVPVGAAARLRRGRGLGAGRRRAARRAAAARRRRCRAGARVLDACAAPGGKTAHLLELADLDLLALDSDPARLARVDETLARLGLRAADRAPPTPRDPARWWDGRPFDAILLDAPCSASGIVRRHPDVRWLRRAERHRRAGGDAGAAARRAVAAAGAGRPAALLHLLGLPGRGPGADRRFFATAAADAVLACDPAFARAPAAAARQCTSTPPAPASGRGGRRLLPTRCSQKHLTRRLRSPCRRRRRTAPLRRRSVLRALGVAAVRALLAARALAGRAPRRARPRRRADRASSSPATRTACYLDYARRLRAGARRRRRAASRRCRSSSSPRPRSSATAGTGATAASPTRCAVWRIVYQPLTSTYRVTTVGGLSQNYADPRRGAGRDQPQRRAGRSPSRASSTTAPPLRRVQLPARHHAAAAADADRHRRPSRTGSSSVERTQRIN